MVQGWRPYSATTQPSSQANQGAGSIQIAHRSNQGFCAQLDLSVLQKDRPNSTNMAVPRPTIKRNDQNIGVTRGTVSSTARVMISGVALRTSTTYFLSSKPNPRSAL